MSKNLIFEKNIILAGVGGQGILTIAWVIDNGAVKQGLSFKQAELHGMSQRGGAVQSHLRIKDGAIHSDLIPKGTCDLIISMEPLESLRYIEYLSPEGMVVSNIEPFVNIPDYPDPEQILDTISTLPGHILIHGEKTARQAAQTPKAQNMVLLGAAQPWLGLEQGLLEESIADLFKSKGEKVVNANVAAFRAGMARGEHYLKLLGEGVTPKEARVWREDL